MSNLGWYQLLTTAAKRVGGPKRLVAIIAGSGLAAGIVGTKGVEGINKKLKANKEKQRKKIESLVTYIVEKDGKSNEGLELKRGDRFKVLEKDGDAVLIEIIGDENSPYFVSGKFISSISNYV